jgi:hypothetical protein
MGRHERPFLVELRSIVAAMAFANSRIVLDYPDCSDYEYPSPYLRQTLYISPPNDICTFFFFLFFYSNYIDTYWWREVDTWMDL